MSDEPTVPTLEDVNARPLVIRPVERSRTGGGYVYEIDADDAACHQAWTYALLDEVERLAAENVLRKTNEDWEQKKREEGEQENARLCERVERAEKERDRLYLENDKLNGETRMPDNAE